MLAIYDGETASFEQENTTEQIIPSIFENSYLKYTFDPSKKERDYPIKLFERSLVNNTAEPCDDFYEFACGNYTYDSQYDMPIFMELKNRAWMQVINTALEENLVQFAVVKGSKKLFAFHKACTKLKDREELNEYTENIIKVLYQNETIYHSMRYLIENGITNYIHLTKERLYLAQWIHYIRPGGVLLPNMKESQIEIIKPNRKEEMTIEMFLKTVGEKWLPVFGKHAKRTDVVMVDNIEYFKRMTPTMEHLEKSIRDFFGFLNSISCTDLTKAMFPMTTCKLFQRLDMLEDKAHGLSAAYNIYRLMLNTDAEIPDDIFRRTINVDEPGLRIGLCSSLLHSDNLGKYVYDVEQSSSNVYTEDTHILVWSHKNLIKRWYKYYDPVYLHFSYPKLLEFGEDSLEWIARTNAVFDEFHNEFVVKLGMLKYPFYSENFNTIGVYSRLGVLVGHEIAHFQTDNYYTDCLETDFEEEDFSDVLGFSKAFEAYDLIETQDVNKCLFFFSYAAIYCSANPDEVFKFHNSARNRVNIPIKYASSRVLEIFNECFQCSKQNLDCINT